MTGKKVSEERRRSRRIRILETFSLAVVVPAKGIMRLPIEDLSDVGIGFQIDDEIFSEEEFKIQKGDVYQLQVYLNQSLGVPIQAKVMRVTTKKKNRIIGAEFVDDQSKALEALHHFVKMLDAATEATS